MTKLLLRLFLKNSQDLTAPQTRGKVGRLSGMVGIACNTLLCVFKLLVGMLSGSVSITADAMNNLSDGASSIVTLVGFKLAEKPADEDHPYGHARVEYLSGLAVAAMIVVIGFELAKTSVEKILNPEAVAFSVPAAVVLIASIAVKLWMFFFNRTLGKQIDSPALLATAADSSNDVITTSVVLLASVVEKLTSWKIDGFMGLGVALFILYSGARLAKETISPLLGETASPELQDLILDTLKNEPHVLGYHDLMVHDYGPGQRFASLHVEMDQRENPLMCHEIIDNIERTCLEQHNVHLVIHYDPVAVGDQVLDEMRQLVHTALTDYDARLTLHDFRMVKGAEHTNLIFDVTLPNDLADQKKAIQAAIDTRLNSLAREKFYTVITFDPQAFNQ